MAARGPNQKANKHGRTPSMVDWTDVADVPYHGSSPDLPRLPRRKAWNPMVVQWWDQVRHMPHCSTWRDTDWMFAVETALMKHHYWELFEAGEATTTAAVDIRRREDQLGTTQEARRKLRIRYVDPDLVADVEDDDTDEVQVLEELAANTAGNVTSIADRRARLTA